MYNTTGYARVQAMNDAPVTPPQPTEVVQPVIEILEVLGRIEVSGARIGGKPLNNSTRWIFDVTFKGGNIEVGLINPYGRRFSPEALSWSISPLNTAAWDGKPCGYHDPQSGVFLLRSNRSEAQQSIRVTIDSIHR